MADTALTRQHRVKLRHQAEALAAGLPPLQVEADRVASTVHQGVHGRRKVGQGETFWQFRRYHTGDAATQIDWRRSAKSDNLFVRETEWEAAQSVWIWCDASASMDFRHSREYPTKQHRADLLALATTALLVRSGERVALLGSDMRPSTGRTALNRVTQALMARDIAGTVSSSLPPAEHLPRFAQVVFISDFLAPLEEIQARVHGYAGRGIAGMMLQILDPAEEALPFTGRVLFEGMEDEGRTLISRVDSLRTQYSARFANHHAGLADIARSVGWSLIVHRTDRPPEKALLSAYMRLARTEG